MNTQKAGLLTLGALAAIAGLTWALLSLAGDDGELAEGVTPAVEGGASPSGGKRRESAADDPAPIHTVRFSESDLVAGSAERNSVRVRGRILDPYGEPLENALVGGVAAEEPGTTQRDGAFEILVPGGGSTVTLLVLAPAHAAFLSQHELEADHRSHDLGDIQLLRGGGIRGQVKGQAGEALVGAIATLTPRSGNGWPSSLDLTEFLQPARTDAEGWYLFDKLMPGRYRITASAAGRQSVRSSTATVKAGVVTAIDALVLDVGYELAGVVLDPGGLPVEAATVRIRNGRNQPRYDGQQQTEVDGCFRMSALPPGPLRIDVTKPGFLTYERSDVDASAGQELVVQLEPGLRITGTVVDAGTAEAVEKFAAAIRPIGRVDPASNGSMTQQLRRQVDTLRASLADVSDPQVRTQQIRIVAQLESRLERVQREWQSRPIAVPANTGPVVEWPEGRFSFEGMDEGLYSVGIASPEHRYAAVEPVELRRGMPAPDLRFELVAGHRLAGIVVSKHDDRPIAGATVQLVRVLEASRAVRERRRSLYPWVFAHGGPQGVTVATTRTGEDGRFEFRQAAPGRCLLSIRHERIADHDTEVLDFPAGREEIRIAVGARASLRGRVGGVPAGREGSVEVLVLGGHGGMRTAKARADGSYRIDDLQPGGYIVRAFPANERKYINRLFGSIFPLHAGAIDPEKIPDRDVTLAEGETRVFDLVLDLPPMGAVQGTVWINGQPARKGRAILRPVPDEAPGSGGLSLRGDCDDLGRFTVRDVPAGNYTLVLYNATRQELHRDAITVAPGATATLQVDLTAGGLRGRVTAPDVAAEELRGYVWVLPGASAAPEDLYEYRRTQRTHRIRVRNGVFEGQGITAGPAMLVIDIRGRARVTQAVVVPARDTLELDLVVAGLTH